MNLSNIEELLVQQNPHWLAVPDQSIGLERDIFPSFCQELTHQKLIIALSGPRRIGKTYLFHQAIAWLIQTQGIPAKNICYFQFTGSLNEKEIIHTVIDLFRKKYAQNGPVYMFLDEIQYLDYWQDEVKLAYDTLPQIKFAVSGSTSLFYHQKSRESLAGRLIQMHLGVLNFREYCRLKQLPEPTTDRATLITHRSLYELEFKKYLSCGQYPELVNNSELDPHQYIVDLAQQIINFDIPYLAPRLNRAAFSSLIKTLSFDLSGEYSASNLAKSLDLDRREITEYLKLLEENHLFHICYNHGLKSQRKKLVGTKKIYSLSLNMSLHVNGFDISYLNDTRVFGRYLENYVYTRLLEKHLTVEYYRIKQKELDFITPKDAYEIKLTPPKEENNYLDLATQLKKDFHLITPDEAYGL